MIIIRTPENCLPLLTPMSSSIGESQAHHTLSTRAPRKRSRQESGCDTDSGIGDSEGVVGSGSGSSENGDNDDSRQGGSQKRVRSEDHVDSQITGWHRNGSSSAQVHAPMAVSSSTSRLSAGSTTNSRYANGSGPLRASSEEPFIPLPPISSPSDIDGDVSSAHAAGHTIQDDIARSMAFDEQIEVLRRSPISFTMSPTSRTDQSRSAETSVDEHAAPDPELSASSGSSPESTGELEESQSEPPARGETSQTNPSGRLRALADTASLHSRLLHAPARRSVTSLPPILPPIGQGMSSQSQDDPFPMPPRLRIYRHPQPGRVQDGTPSRSPSPSLDLERIRAQVLGTRHHSRMIDEPLQSSSNGGTEPFSSNLDLMSNGGVRNLNDLATSPVSSLDHHPLSRRDMLQEMHSPLDPIDIEANSMHELDRVGDSPFLSSWDAPSHRFGGPPNPPASLSVPERPFPIHSAGQGSNDRHGPSGIMDDPLVDSLRGNVNGLGLREDTAGSSPWRRSTNDRLPGFSWNGPLHETDADRDVLSRHPPSIFDDGRRRTSDLGRDAPLRHPRALDDVSRGDSQRPSLWDLPTDFQRRNPGQGESDFVTHVPSPSSSSMSSYGRSTSRSLLDPTLSFGSGSLGNSRNTPGQAQEPGNRSRLWSRARLNSWLDDRSMDEDEEGFEVNHSAPGSERRVEREGLTSLSSFLSPIDSPTSEHHRASPIGLGLRHLGSSRRSQPDSIRLSSHSPLMDEESGSRFPSRSVHGPEFRSTAPRLHSSAIREHDVDLRTPEMSDLHITRSIRRHFPAGRLVSETSTSRESDLPFSSSGLDDPLPGPSRIRLRRLAHETSILPSNSPELPSDSMQDVIPEPNAREMDSIDPSFRRRASPFSSGHLPMPRIEPPPRPIEPRLSPWDVGPRPTVREPPRQFRSTSPLSRQNSFPPNAVHANDSPIVRPPRPLPMSYRSIFNESTPSGPNESMSRQSRLSSGIDEGQRIPSPVVNTTRLVPRSEQGGPTQSVTQVTHESGASRVETFNELVRRRAARADAQARANRRPLLSDGALRPAHRLPRPSFLRDEMDISSRFDGGMSRTERRTDDTVFDSPPSASLGSEMEERDRLDRQRVALLLERSVSGRYNLFDRPSSRREWVSDQEGSYVSQSNARATMSDRSARQPSSQTSIDTYEAGDTQGNDAVRERQELHDAIGRRARDDELSTRRSLPNTDLSQYINSRSIPPTDTTTRNLQRRLWESQAELGRALRALDDQWGELEMPGDRNLDLTQSRMHRFGERLRRRMVPPMNYSDPSADHDPVSGRASSSTLRRGHRSPSPTTAAARLQARQARFARAQGRYREMGTDLFGEHNRGRGPFASRAELLGGSRFASRNIARNLGDYMRDEDFDSSYENLLRLAAAIGDAKPRGTPAHLIAAMPTGFFKDFAAPGCDSRCPICLDDYKDLDPVLRITDCEHWFHKECLEQWLAGESSCPICRRRIGDYEQNDPSDNMPGPSRAPRDDGSDDDDAPGGSGRSSSNTSLGLTLEELSPYASTLGW